MPFEDPSYRDKFNNSLHHLEQFVTKKLGVDETLNYAESKAEAIAGHDYGSGGATDALRHLLLSGELHRTHPLLADPLLFGHELGTNVLQGQSPEERQQDLINNRTGQLIGSVAHSRDETEWLAWRALPGASVLSGNELRNPSMLEDLPNILSRHLQMLNQNPDPVEDLKNMLTSGPFKDASDRQSIWGKRAAANFPEHFAQPAPIQVAGLPIGVGGGGNNSAMQQLKELDTNPVSSTPVLPSENPGPVKPQAPYKLVPAVNEASRAKMLEEQDKARAEAERQAEKARIRKLMGM